MLYRILFILTLSNILFSQKSWIKTYGADEIDGSNHVLELDNGYLITGFTQSFGNGGNDLWIIRTDRDRKELWNRFYGGMSMETGYEAIHTKDNGFIILAQTYSYGSGLSDIWIVKIDSSGNKMWDKTYGGERVDIGYDICRSNDGGYVIAGMTFSEKTNSQDAYIVKIDSVGNAVWTQTYGGIKNDGVSSVSPIADDYGYIVVGHTNSYMLDKSRIKKRGFIGRIIASIFKKKPTSEVWIISIDEYGDKNWHNTYGGKKEDVGKKINLTKDGGYIITAETNTIGKGKNDVWVIKIDKNGKMKWDTTIGGKEDEYASSTVINLKNETIVTGFAIKEKGIIGKIKAKILKKKPTSKKSFVVKLNKKGEKKWDTDFNEEEENLSSFITYNDKHILLSGQNSTRFNGAGDAWLVSLNNKGKQNWQESYGGRGADGGNYAAEVSDGGYIMVGYTDAYGNGKNDVWLIKTDFRGEKEWSNVYGGSEDDYGWGVAETPDKGFVIIGETFSYGNGQSDVYLFKVDSLGNKIWDNTFGGLAEDVGYSIVNANDGGYVIACLTRSYGKGGSDGMLVKFNSNGDKEWEKLFGGKGFDYFRSIIKKSKIGYIVSGGTRSFSEGDSEGWILSVDDNGFLIWQNTYGDNGEDGFNMVKETTNNGYIAIGYSSSFFSSGMSDIFMARIDSLGNKVWQKYHGGKQEDRGYAVWQCADGGYVIAGETSSYGNGKNDIWVIKTNSIGTEKWNTTFGGNGVDIGRSIIELPGGGFIISGTSTISNLSFDAILIKTDKKGKSRAYSK